MNRHVQAFDTFMFYVSVADSIVAFQGLVGCMLPLHVLCIVCSACVMLPFTVGHSLHLHACVCGCVCVFAAHQQYKRGHRKTASFGTILDIPEIVVTGISDSMAVMVSRRGVVVDRPHLCYNQHRHMSVATLSAFCVGLQKQNMNSVVPSIIPKLQFHISYQFCCVQVTTHIRCIVT